VAHWWKIYAGGADICTRPGTAARDCGARIPYKARLSFTETYASGAPSLIQTVTWEDRSWSKLGIQIRVQSQPLYQVLAESAPCAATQPTRRWELANWGGGWIYSPEVEPTSEQIFAPGAPSNSGSYDDPTAAALIRSTVVGSSAAALGAYEDYLAQDLPVIWQPNPANALVEVAKSLKGVTPLNALLNLTPEFWRLS
jgi:peptide/nickel transport system substrate-binding protein